MLRELTAKLVFFFKKTSGNELIESFLSEPSLSISGD